KKNSLLREGIFTPIATFELTGKYNFIIDYKSKDVVESFDIGEIVVYQSQNEIPVEEETEDGGISFLKEQQWKTEFGTEAARNLKIHSAIIAMGEVLPRQQSYVEIISPTDGVLNVQHNKNMVNPGTLMKKGQQALVLTPPLNATNSWIEWVLEYERSKSEFDRAEKLLKKQSISVSDYEKIKYNYLIQKTKYRAFLTEENTEKEISFDLEKNTLKINAPIDGIVTEIMVYPGQKVTAGQKLMTIIDPYLVWIKVNLFEKDYYKIDKLQGLSLILPGLDSLIVLDRKSLNVLNMGNIIDSQTRSIPILIEIKNSAGILKIGQVLQAELYTTEQKEELCVPKYAVYDDDGNIITEGDESNVTWDKQFYDFRLRYAGNKTIIEYLSNGYRTMRAVIERDADKNVTSVYKKHWHASGAIIQVEEIYRADFGGEFKLSTGRKYYYDNSGNRVVAHIQRLTDDPNSLRIDGMFTSSDGTRTILLTIPQRNPESAGEVERHFTEVNNTLVSWDNETVNFEITVDNSTYTVTGTIQRDEFGLPVGAELVIKDESGTQIAIKDKNGDFLSDEEGNSINSIIFTKEDFQNYPLSSNEEIISVVLNSLTTRTVTSTVTVCSVNLNGVNIPYDEQFLNALGIDKDTLVAEGWSGLIDINVTYDGTNHSVRVNGGDPVENDVAEMIFEALKTSGMIEGDGGEVTITEEDISATTLDRPVTINVTLNPQDYVLSSRDYTQEGLPLYSLYDENGNEASGVELTPAEIERLRSLTDGTNYYSFADVDGGLTRENWYGLLMLDTLGDNTITVYINGEEKLVHLAELPKTIDGQEKTYHYEPGIEVTETREVARGASFTKAERRKLLNPGDGSVIKDSKTYVFNALRKFGTLKFGTLDFTIHEEVMFDENNVPIIKRTYMHDADGKGTSNLTITQTLTNFGTVHTADIQVEVEGLDFNEDGFISNADLTEFNNRLGVWEDDANYDFNGDWVINHTGGNNDRDLMTGKNTWHPLGYNGIASRTYYLNRYDINKDGSINELDKDAINTKVTTNHKIEADSNFDAKYDLDENGILDSNDKVLLQDYLVERGEVTPEQEVYNKKYNINVESVNINGADYTALETYVDANDGTASKAYYQRCDVNGDGVISQEDIDRIENDYMKAVEKKRIKEPTPGVPPTFFDSGYAGHYDKDGKFVLDPYDINEDGILDVKDKQKLYDYITVYGGVERQI
ncbi:MAG: efflux RND transporter periplasmic adaptor subunit, partial [Nanoarchaeota archaeon]|nr:efflux RND transporter periplasmic adaptor subunit [Nanoarchaeota archaeon]